MMGENHNKIICSVRLRLSEQIQQGGDLFIERRQVPLHYQMQRRGAASAMAQRQRFSTPCSRCARIRSSGNQPNPT